ncbi:TetR/AcrR family transcriptional regulator [Nocardia sp. NPDC051570]|uniref:TetR/AcrR family transcriptional regulator n=1 Tax=Nocardia sp. NPDC051570 TaxID=3364324 RepID=UPI0037AECCAA
MPIRPPTHRAAGQARRAALLDAAVEVIAENGVAGATHRAIAARARVPLSTTSYFFASIDELVAAAMELAAEGLIARIDAARGEIVGSTVDEMVDRYVDLLFNVPQTFLAAEFEIYVHCRHQPALRDLAHRMMSGFERSAEELLHAVGATDPYPAGRALIALIDGFALQRFAWPRGADDRAQLATAMRTLVHAYVR